MKQKLVFIDGQFGTVGLQIRNRLKNRKELKLIEISESLKKDITEKKRILNSVDIVFLCLPDEASKQSVSLITNIDVIVLDGSTAFRTDADWVYGIPELHKKQRGNIKRSKRISVPGCYATGFNTLLHPLVKSKILDPDYPVTSYSITGYSGGGTSMIKEYEENSNNDLYSARPKNLDLNHKHLPEMQKYSLLNNRPIFTPIVGKFYNGMLVFIPIYKKLLLNKNIDLIDFYTTYYKDENFINVLQHKEIQDINSDFISPLECNGTNRLDILTFETEDQILLVARLDNLGKGASGAAVQCLNIVLGIDEETGL
ncbi:MAG: N-acetyl-gamma-glutamyl-phosphate reductase [Spirochaetaceae bacterium]